MINAPAAPRTSRTSLGSAIAKPRFQSGRERACNIIATPGAGPLEGETFNTGTTYCQHKHRCQRPLASLRRGDSEAARVARNHKESVGGAGYARNRHPAMRERLNMGRTIGDRAAQARAVQRHGQEFRTEGVVWRIGSGERQNGNWRRRNVARGVPLPALPLPRGRLRPVVGILFWRPRLPRICRWLYLPR